MREELGRRGIDVRRPEVAEYGMKELLVSEPDGRELVLESPTEDRSGKTTNHPSSPCPSVARRGYR